MARQVGWIDTNVFIHSLTRDLHSEACRALLAELEQGSTEAWLDPIVLHELSYALPRTFRWDRQRVGEYLLLILAAQGIQVHGDKQVLGHAIGLWMKGDVAFADALLTARANADGTTVCTVNAEDIQRLGGRALTPTAS